MLLDLGASSVLSPNHVCADVSSIPVIQLGQSDPPPRAKRQTAPAPRCLLLASWSNCRTRTRHHPMYVKARVLGPPEGVLVGVYISRAKERHRMRQTSRWCVDLFLLGRYSLSPAGAMACVAVIGCWNLRRKPALEHVSQAPRHFMKEAWHADSRSTGSL